MALTSRIDRGLRWYERLAGIIGATVTYVGVFTAAWYFLRGRTVPAWVAIGAVLSLFLAYLAGLLWFAFSARPQAPPAATPDPELEARVQELQRTLESSDSKVTSDEYRKRLLYDCLESIQQEIANESDWDLDSLVQRGVLGPVQSLLTRTEKEDVRLAVFVPREDDMRWSMRWAEGHRPESVRNYNREIDKTLAGLSYRRGDLIEISNVREDPRFEANPKETRPYASQVAMPLRIGERIVGAFSVVSTVEAAFSPSDVSFLKIVGAILDVLLTLEMDIKRWVAHAEERGYQPDEGKSPPEGG